MTKQYYYHGTSADNLASILKHGISTSEIKLWSCSLDEIYLWCPEEIAKSNNQEDEEDEYKQEEGFRRAFESAQIACAAAKDCRAVVIKVLLNPADISPDLSCENMDGSGAVCIKRNIIPDEIISIHVSNDLSLIKGYFISLVKDMDYCHIAFTNMDILVADLFKNAEIYPETMDDIVTWTASRNIEIPELI